MDPESTPEVPLEQPKKRKKRGKSRFKRSLQMNPMRRKLIEGRARGMNLTEAAKFAGYSNVPAASKAFSMIRLHLPAIFAKEGMTCKRLAKKLISLTEAKKTEFFHKDGIVIETREVEDNGTQLGASREIAKIFGFYPEDAHDEDSGRPSGSTINLVIADSGIATAIAEKLARSGRYSGQPVLGPAVDENAGRSGPDESI